MKKLITILLCISLIINFFLFFTLTKKIDKYEDEIKKITVEIKKQKKEQEKKDYKRENIVFLGDSITEWYPFGSLYERNIPIVNSGKAGYRTFELLPELKELVYQYNPTKVFILIGTNDINTHSGKKQLINNIEKMIKRIKKHRKQCKIYVQSIYPVNKEDNQKENEIENKDIKDVNKKIRKICKKHNVTYINVYKYLIDEGGYLDLQYTKDGLHLNDLGYLKVTKVLTPYVEE